MASAGNLASGCGCPIDALRSQIKEWEAGRQSPSQTLQEIKLLLSSQTTSSQVSASSAPSTDHGNGASDKHRLTKELKRRSLPKYFELSARGKAPEGKAWICVLCTSLPLPYRLKSSEIQRHLRKSHDYTKEQVKEAFGSNDGEGYKGHFGPFSQEQAKRNGLNVREFQRRGLRAHKRSKDGKAKEETDVKNKPATAEAVPEQALGMWSSASVDSNIDPRLGGTTACGGPTTRSGPSEGERFATERARSGTFAPCASSVQNSGTAEVFGHGTQSTQMTQLGEQFQEDVSKSYWNHDGMQLSSSFDEKEWRGWMWDHMIDQTPSPKEAVPLQERIISNNPY